MLLTSALSASSAVNLNYKNYWLIECKLKQIMFPGSLAKGIPDPFDVIILQAAQQYHIEAAGGGGAQLLQIMPGGEHQLALLAGSDAGRRPAECIAPSQPDFDEHQCILILADQVDFAEAAAVIGFEQFQPLPLQEGRGQLFRFGAGIT